MVDRAQEQAISVQELESLLEKVPGEAPLLVGIRDRHHFSALLGELPVVGVAVLQRGDGWSLVFDVESVT